MFFRKKNGSIPGNKEFQVNKKNDFGKTSFGATSKDDDGIDTLPGDSVIPGNIKPRSIVRQRINRSISWGREHERAISTAAFLGGFAIDLLTLNRIDQWFDNFVLASYLVIASVSILILNMQRDQRDTLSKIQTVALYATQFAFGGLLSGFVIFYTKSASWYVAWPFLIALYAAFIGNDRLREWYRRMEFQVTALFVALFALMIFWVPILVRMISDMVFVLSGIVALILIFLALSVLYRVASEVTPESKKRIRGNIFAAFFVFNVLYFTNIIPPIPLSLKAIDIYYDVTRDSTDGYVVLEKEHAWYDVRSLWRDEYIVGANAASNRAYVMTSVFGPNNLSATVSHVWQKHNEQANQWEQVFVSPFSVTGGRDGGFRWYSFVDRPSKGDWRVIVISNRKEMGRINFEVRDRENGEEIMLAKKRI